MYYYAVLNTKDIVEYISEQENEVTYYEYISISTSDQSLVGKWYDREGVYGTVGAFLEVPISIQAEHSSSQINYKGQDVWLDEKLDSYATQSDLSTGLAGKANLNHFHNTATQTSDGYMSSGDKAKLDGIEANANLYVHPDTHAASMITGLASVSTTGSYNDLTDKPTIPTIPTALPADGGNADTLDGYHAAYFASGQHNHDAVYAPANHTHDYAASSHNHSTATTSEAGFMSAEDKAKLNGIASGANNYTHPASHPASMITETDSLKVMTAAERTKLSGIAENANNYTHPETHSAAIIEETSLKKVMTAEERTKLAGIESGANNYSHPSTHPATMITGLSDVATSGSYDDLSDKPTSMTPTAHTHVQSEITGLETALSGKSNTNHTHTAASTSVAGFMSAADKTKLNGIATNANAYTHPSTHAASMITGLADIATSGSYNDLSDTPTSMTPKAHTHAQSDITGLATALSGKSDTSHTHSTATTTAAGFMSKDDKSKLDGIATGANKTTVDSALSSTSTNPVQNKVVNTALSGKAESSHTHSSATTSAAGFMSKEDKTKLDGIATGANKTTVDSALSSTSTNPVQNKVINTALAGKAASSHTHAQSDITGLATALSGKSDTTHTHSNATSSTNGFMSATDKSAFDTAKNRGQIGVCKNVLTTGENLDDYIYSGTYTFGGTYTPENIPAGVNGWLVVLRWSCSDENATVKQLWFRHGTVGANDFEIYVRTKVGSAAFGSWSKIYTTSNPPTAAEVGAISKDLQMTADDGDVYVVWSNQDVVSKITALKKGMYTAYAQSGTTNNPKTTEGWRFLIHKTTDTVGWVQAFGSSGSVYVGNVDSDGWKGWKCVYDADPSPLWTGKLYMSGSESSPQTVTPSKKLSECRTGYLLVWSDYDPDTSTANDADFATTFIPKKNPTGGNWSGKSFLCDIPRYIGGNVNDVDTERRIMKILYIYDNRIVGSPNNSKGDRNDVVLRCIWEI